MDSVRTSSSSYLKRRHTLRSPSPATITDNGFIREQTHQKNKERVNKDHHKKRRERSTSSSDRQHSKDVQEPTKKKKRTTTSDYREHHSEHNKSSKKQKNDSTESSVSNEVVKNKSNKKQREKNKNTRASSSSSSSSSRDSSQKSKKRKDRDKKKRKKDRKKNNNKSNISWGKYGVIQECDLWSKKQEFQLWLLEVKNIAAERIPQWEEKQLFREFMEDYNTGTLPNKKYFNLEKWEMKHAKRMQAQQPENMRTPFDDERYRRIELQQLRKKQQDKELEDALLNIKQDIFKVSDMRHQKILRTQMQTLFQMGHIKEALKIQDRLRPDEQN